MRLGCWYQEVNAFTTPSCCTCVVVFNPKDEAVVEEFIYKAKPLEAMVVLNPHKQQAGVRYCYKISSRVLILNTLFTGK